MKERTHLWQYDQKDGEYRFYADLSTEQALAYFDDETAAKVIAFGATQYQNLGWATPADLPELLTVGELRSFLRAEEKICLVEFEAEVAGFGSLGSHDDGECTFKSERQSAVLELMLFVLPPSRAGEIRTTLVQYPGSYVSWDSVSDDLRIFATFDDYLASRAVEARR